ncbi:hypothetical protein E5843_07500 [Luteimonas yindakuii]|uniref:hypothetical protein n=1 Tax=Luteimonas yindakuii TaxID=2565782 RepID=UPI0010A57720|nr:hypothetical protein [Luteimonas yindakuii]QCO67658.1 hypothetical protein E5843_07500 [Luteimonas yindakuii]
MARKRPSPATSPAASRPPRRRRLGVGLAALALVVIVLMGLQWYRGHQLVRSCTGNGGSWDAERHACTFGGPNGAPSSSTSAPPEPATQ